MHHQPETAKHQTTKARSPKPALDPYCIDEITLTRSDIMKARYEDQN